MHTTVVQFDDTFGSALWSFVVQCVATGDVCFARCVRLRLDREAARRVGHKVARNLFCWFPVKAHCKIHNAPCGTLACADESQLPFDQPPSSPPVQSVDRD